MKKILALTASALLMLSLTGCETSEPVQEGQVETGQHGNTITFVKATTDDGNTVDCFELSGFRAGGLSCDWGNAH